MSVDLRLLFLGFEWQECVASLILTGHLGVVRIWMCCVYTTFRSVHVAELGTVTHNLITVHSRSTRSWLNAVLSSYLPICYVSVGLFRGFLSEQACRWF